MKIQQMKDIVDTYDFLCEVICGKGLTYDQVKIALERADGNDYSVAIVNEEEDLFDVDVGLMNFTIYKDEEDGFRLCENATYYVPREEGGTMTTYLDDTISVEL